MRGRRPNPGRWQPLTAGLMAVLLAWPSTAAPRPATNGQPVAGRGNLKIVVLEGEASVNIIQQKTAVAPLVEVRDRNDQPVAGALVLFAVRGGRSATFGNGATVSVTTDTSGRAAAAGLVPRTNGVVQIDVSASFQGETVTTTIRQTNVPTPADVAAVAGTKTTAGATPTSTRTSGAGTATAGGISPLTIGLIAAGAGAAAIGVAVATRDGSSAPAPPTAPAPPPPTQTITVSGSMDLPVTVTFAGAPGGSCAWPESTTATARMTVQVPASGVVTGSIDFSGGTAVGGVTACASNRVNLTPVIITSATALTANATVSGTAAALAFTVVQTINDALGNQTRSLAFTGSLSNGVVSGTLRGDRRLTYPSLGTGQGTGTTTLTLR